MVSALSVQTTFLPENDATPPATLNPCSVLVEKTEQMNEKQIKKTISDHIKNSFAGSGVSAVAVDVEHDGVRVTVSTLRPGMIIGAGGSVLKSLQDELLALTKTPVLEINVRDLSRDDDATTLTGNVGVYYDAPNIYVGARKAGWEVDNGKLYALLKKKYDLSVANYYDCWSYERDGKGGWRRDAATQQLVLHPHHAGVFRSVFNNTLFRIVAKEPKMMLDAKKKLEPIKNNMDGHIMVDAMADHDKWDVFVLLSGDGDFEYLLQRLLERGKEVHVYAFKSALSYETKRLVKRGAVKLFTLDDFRDELEIAAV